MPQSSKPFLAGTGRDELAAWCRTQGAARFRATQIAEWVYSRYTVDPGAMSNLPQPLRQSLPADFFCPGSQVAEVCESPDGTAKLLLSLYDGEQIEMVVIPGGEERITFCLSTQVGCPVQCYFCASGRGGLVRNLSCGEILEQFLIGIAHCGRKPDNLVFMGIGEGLLNFQELSDALNRLTSPEYFGMSPRRITVSTSGYVPGIRRLAELGREYTLAISLHAADDETRARIIPDTMRYPIAEIMAAADEYLRQAGRMVTLEYTLLKGVNDSTAAAARLAELAKSHHAKVNLIPYNSTGDEFQRPSARVIREFAETLEKAGAHVTVRTERGGDQSSACGQLRAQRK